MHCHSTLRATILVVAAKDAAVYLAIVGVLFSVFTILFVQFHQYVAKNLSLYLIELRHSRNSRHIAWFAFCSLSC